MSSLLRSLIFSRYIASSSRYYTFKTATRGGSQHTSLAPSIVSHYSSSKNDMSFDTHLQKIDTEIKRIGRIKTKNVNEIIETIANKSEISSLQSLFIIKCFGEQYPEELPERRTELVQRVFETFLKTNVPLDLSHYNALLKVYIENEHTFSTDEFLNNMEKKGIQPNRVTYQWLMWGRCQQGDLKGASTLLEKMKELEMPMSEWVMNALVVGHVFHNDIEGAQSVIDTLSAAGLHPSSRTYTLLACGFAKAGDLNSIKNIMSKAESKQSSFTNKDILDIVEVLAVNGHTESATQMLSNIQKNSDYGREAIMHIYSLINKGQEEIAKEVFKTVAVSSPTQEDQEQVNFKGNFFVKQMVKTSKSPEKVIKLCKEMQDEGLAPMALYMALEAAIIEGNFHLADQLIKEVPKHGIQIRSHFYWPLLVAKGKEGDEEGLLQIVSSILREDVASIETYTNYVIPFLLKNNSPQDVYTKMQLVGCAPIMISKSMLIALLNEGNLEQAANFAVQYAPSGDTFQISKFLIPALEKTKDIESFVNILSIMTSERSTQYTDDYSSKSKNDALTDDDPKQTQQTASSIVEKAVKTLKDKSLVDSLFTSLLSKGILVNGKNAEHIAEFLGEKMDENLSAKLCKLTSDEKREIKLSAPTSRNSQVYLNSKRIKFLIEKKDTGDLSNLKSRLLTAYVLENNVEEVNNCLKKLEDEKVDLTNKTLALLVEFFCQNDDIENAIKYKKMLNEKYPDFQMHNYKVLKMALAYVRANRFDESVAFLKENQAQSLDPTAETMEYNSLCWQILNYLADQKDVAKVKEMTETLLSCKYVSVTSTMLGASVRVHLNKEDVDGALQQFEEICRKYRCTPCKHDLTKRLILLEDAERLQKVADLSTEIHGETNTLYDLALAFVESGRVRQARRILETPGLSSRPIKLQRACENYVKEGKTECLEALVEATKQLSYIDQVKIFYHLLQSYCKNNDTVKALDLWTVLQEEGITPSDEFLIHLAQHLKSKNQPVPFVMPESKDTALKEPKIEKKKSNTNNKEIDRDSKMKSEIMNLINSSDLKAAVAKTVEAFEAKIQINQRVISKLIKTLSEKGTVDDFDCLEKYFSEDLKKAVMFEKNKAKVICCRDGIDTYIDNLLTSLENAKTPDDYQEIYHKLPKSSDLSKILEQPQLEQKCQKIMFRLANNGVNSAAMAMFTEYTIKGKQDVSDSIWKQYLSNSRVRFGRILKWAMQNKEPNRIEYLIERLQTNENITKNTLGFVFSKLITLYLDIDNLEAAKKCLDRAIDSGITIDNMNVDSLKSLKAKLEATGERLKYELPEQVSK